MTASTAATSGRGLDGLGLLHGGGSRRRSVPHLVLGLLLVVTCSLGATVGALSMSDRRPVLVLARAIAAGQPLTERDLRTVGVWVDATVDVVPAARVTEVVGRTVAVPLPAGAVLPWAALGAAQVPPAGEAVAAVGVKPGRFPPRLAPGARVWVVAGEDDTGLGMAGSGGPWPALVTGVDELGTGELVTVVSLQLPESAAQAVAALPDGAVRVVLRDSGP